LSGSWRTAFPTGALVRLECLNHVIVLNQAQACWQGACNPHGIIRSLAEHMGEIPPGRCRESLDLKIILGQLSFVVGESLGPREETCAEFRDSEQAAEKEAA
jgi:hypothetical protein